MKKICVFVLLFVAALLLGCMPVSDGADTAASENTVAKSNGNIYYDPSLYTMTVRIGGSPKEHTEIHASGSASYYNGIGGGSMVVWQDGKGIIPAYVIEMEPTSSIVSVGDSILLKTEDLKMSRLEEGWVVEIKCRMDYEPLTELHVPNEVVDAELTQTWELDLCRMSSPVFIVETEETDE